MILHFEVRVGKAEEHLLQLVLAEVVWQVPHAVCTDRNNSCAMIVNKRSKCSNCVCVTAYKTRFETVRAAPSAMLQYAVERIHKPTSNESNMNFLAALLHIHLRNTKSFTSH